LINAIKFGRVDIVEEIYERCFYLPRMAIKDGSTYDYVQSVSEEQIKQVVGSLDGMSHLLSVDKIALKAILSGRKI
jgi:hypothetical protein